NDFEVAADCNGAYYLGSTFPAGWDASPNPYGWTCTYDSTFGSRSPGIWFYYNDPNYGTGDGHSYLYTPTYSFASWFAARVQFNSYWRADQPLRTPDGIVEARPGGGGAWPAEFGCHPHQNPDDVRGHRAPEDSKDPGYPT